MPAHEASFVKKKLGDMEKINAQNEGTIIELQMELAKMQEQMNQFMSQNQPFK